MSSFHETRSLPLKKNKSCRNLVISKCGVWIYLCVFGCVALCVAGQNSASLSEARPASSAAAAVNSGSSLSEASTTTGSGAVPDDAEYSDADYDDKDVQFDQSPPNVLILLADPENGTTTPLANQPNTEVILDPSLRKIHLFCSAFYPIKWVYTGQGVSNLFHFQNSRGILVLLFLWFYSALAF